MPATRPAMVVLAPIAPAATGNGLAMRVLAMVVAAARHHDVYLIVAPVSGRLPSPPLEIPGVRHTWELPLTEVGDRMPLVTLMADPVWRQRLAGLGTWPDEVAAAPPSLVTGIDGWLRDVEIAGVLACRLALAPLGLALAERRSVPFMVDADDADAEYFERRGEQDAAARWDRVAELCLPRANLVTAASQGDATGLSDRYGVAEHVVAVPNGIVVPDVDIASRPGEQRVLFVGNMTYPPNAEGVHWFVGSVLPLLGPDVVVDVVGAAPPDINAISHDQVCVRGWVADLHSLYRNATVAIVPIWSGSGTRIKVLEAFAHGCPVVSTTLGVAGLDATPGTHLLVADTAKGFADAVASVLTSEVAVPMVAAARQLVVDSYDAASIAESTATLFSRVLSEAMRS